MPMPHETFGLLFKQWRCCCKTQELAGALCQCWEATETAYIDNCKKVFVMMRLERDQIIRYFYNVG